MKSKTILLLSLSLATAGIAPARDAKSAFNASSTPKAETQWNTNPKYWENLLREPRADAGVRMGKSDYVIRGPLFHGLRRQKSSADLSLGQRFLRLPVVRLFVPTPMPSPPDGGKYFAWGESTRPWTAIAEGGAAGDLSNPVTHEARSLIMFSR